MSQHGIILCQIRTKDASWIDGHFTGNKLLKCEKINQPHISLVTRLSMELPITGSLLVDFFFSAKLNCFKTLFPIKLKIFQVFLIRSVALFLIQKSMGFENPKTKTATYLCYVMQHTSTTYTCFIHFIFFFSYRWHSHMRHHTHYTLHSVYYT